VQIGNCGTSVPGLRVQLTVEDLIVFCRQKENNRLTSGFLDKAFSDIVVKGISFQERKLTECENIEN